MNRLEKIMISFFRKTVKNALKEKENLHILFQELDKIKNIKEENKIMEYFDYHRWCAQKIKTIQ